MGFGILEGLFLPRSDKTFLTRADKVLAHASSTILLDGQSVHREAL